MASSGVAGEHTIVNRERFIRQRRSDWQQFEILTARLKERRASRWLSQDVSELSRLYRSICYDLSLVQSREWGARLEQYLNDLVAQGHNCLYRSPPRSVTAMWEFIIAGFPQLLRKRSGSLFIALGLFAIPFIVSAIVAALRPDLAELVAGRESLDMARQTFGAEMYSDVDSDFAGQRSMMAGFYVRNNIGIAFRAFAFGAFCGIGTATELLSNGIQLGMVFGYMVFVGGVAADNFFSFVITHGAFELTALVVAGAAGLVLGQGVMFPGERTRMASLRHHGTESLLIALGAGGMLFVAALIEAYFSPLPIDSIYKYLVGTLLWFVVGLYLTLAGRHSSERMPTQSDEVSE
jgi:uncharacterized membrane protein SpoIIM required for sporulation